jgi:hypothetical protein
MCAWMSAARVVRLLAVEQRQNSSSQQDQLKPVAFSATRYSCPSSHTGKNGAINFLLLQDSVSACAAVNISEWTVHELRNARVTNVSYVDMLCCWPGLWVLPSRWAGCCSEPPSVSTSRSGSTSAVLCLGQMVRAAGRLAAGALAAAKHLSHTVCATLSVSHCLSHTVCLTLHCPAMVAFKGFSAVGSAALP